MMRNNIKSKFKKKHYKNFSLEERDRLINVFAWLIEQDKKQNPENYKFSKTNYD